MNKEETKQAIIREWMALPASERATDFQAFEFSIKAKDRYSFKTKGDPYQTIKAWLSAYVGKP